MTLGAKRRCHGAHFVHNAIEILRVINFFGGATSKECTLFQHGIFKGCFITFVEGLSRLMFVLFFTLNSSI